MLFKNWDYVERLQFFHWVELMQFTKLFFTGDFGNTNAVPLTPECGGGGGGGGRRTSQIIKKLLGVFISIVTLIYLFLGIVIFMVYVYGVECFQCSPIIYLIISVLF